MPDTDKKTILVVDDDREIVRAISITLEREGYSVLKAYDGLEALDCVTSRDIHLIIIDVMMPRLDGLSAVMKTPETAWFQVSGNFETWAQSLSM